MNILLDSNILLRLSQPGHSHEQVTIQAIDLLQREHRCVVVPQTIYEYWVVATRPIAVNGLGFDPAFAAAERNRFLQLFALLRDDRAIFERWQQLVDDRQIVGVRAHDTRYVAAMLRHGLTHLMTFNDADFRRFDEVTVFTPTEIVDHHQADATFLQQLIRLEPT